MIGQNEFYTRNFQLDLLAHLWRSPQFRTHLSQQTVSQEDLDVPVHKAILVAIYEFIRTHPFVLESQEELSIQHIIPVLVGMIQSGEIRDLESHAVDVCLEEIDQVPLTPDFYKNSMQGFLVSQRQRRAINRAEIRGLDPQEFAREIQQISDGVRSLAADENVVFNALDQGVSCLPDEDKMMLGTGISSIDALLGGGVPVRKVAMLCAYTGIGKTSMGINLAHNNARLGYRTAFASLEMPKSEIMCRYYALALHYPYDLMWKGDPSGQLSRAQINADVAELLHTRTSNEPLVRAALRNFEVWDMSEKTTTHEDIEHLLIKAEEEGRPYHLLVIDYIDIMELPEAKKYDTDRKENKDKLGKISDEIRKVTARHEIVTWVLTQANDEGEKTPNPGLRASRDSRKKNDPVSTWCSLGGTEKELERGIYNFRCAKNRDGRKFTIKIKGDGNYQRFSDYEPEEDLAEKFSPSARRRAQVEDAGPSPVQGEGPNGQT